MSPSRANPGTLELRARAARDWTRLGAGSAALVRVTGLGDPHDGGRRVSRVRFSGGLTMIYKPRPVGPEVIWHRAVRWLGRRAAGGPFLLPAIVARARYGWVDDLKVRQPASDGAARRFYRRAGTLLALLDGLEVRDAHRDNLLAVGDQPVLVDAEAMVHPRFAGFRDTPSLALTGFLPGVGAGDDHAGLGAGLRASGPRPIRFQTELIEGYTNGFGILRDHGAELLRPSGPLRGLGTTETRVILRPTAWYREVLRSPAVWDRPDVAPLPIPRAHHRTVERLERSALANGDVPVFHCLGDGTDLLANGVVVARSCFRTSGLAMVARRLRALSDAEERRSVDLLRGVLALDAWRTVPGRATRDRSDRRWRSR